MNNNGSSNERFFRFFVLMLAGTMLFQYYFAKPSGNNTPPRPTLTLKEAWKQIDPAQGPVLDKVSAVDEVAKLQKQIDANPQDGLANWSRLRQGLIHQYILKDLKEEQHSSGFLGAGPKVTVFPDYNQIILHAAGDEVEAQALYQQGDLLWRRSMAKEGKPAQDAVTNLEALVHKGRGSSAFLNYSIFVPVETDPAKVPVDGLPEGGFKQATVKDLHGVQGAPNPQGIIDRVNTYYSTSTYYRVFDWMVNLFGARPEFSYGLAILVFAVCTRVALQPLNKKQYESMRGMSIIAPEMKKIQDRYKGKTDQQSQMKMVQEIQALQRRHGVNPYLGCGLAFVQMPIFFLVVYPLIQHYEPKMELVHASFLWISSLAQRDIPLLVLYGISMFFSFRLSSTPPADEMQRNQQIILSIAMPVLFPFFLLTYPSAFTMYWMTFNIVSTIFQWRMMKAADPKKNVIKTLMGTDLVLTNPTADAVPARPKDESADKKGDKGEKKGASGTKSPAALNGASPVRNGATPTEEAQGQVLKASEDKKKKK